MLTSDNKRMIDRVALSAATLAMALVPIEATLEANSDRAALDSAIQSLDECCGFLMALGTGHSRPKGCACCDGETFNPVIRERALDALRDFSTEFGCSADYIDTLCAEGGAT